MSLTKDSKAHRKDIKNAIKAFIKRVESLEKDEGPELSETIGFGAEYKLIQDAQLRNKRDNLLSMDAGKTDKNLKKNRYKDILPYDDHRDVLNVIDDDPDTSYINASKLMGVRGTGGYIATQGPLARTVNDFWRMIWEFNVEIIFMACKIVENGKIKCKQYWNDVGKTEEFENITVLTETEEKIMSDCDMRNFRVTKGDEVRHVVQYHYSGWPDHGIPDDAGHIRDMIGLMRQTRNNDQAPLLVHCSAGCGRTGAIVAIDYVWTMLEEGKFDDSFSLFDLICNFREQRMSIVQTADQYALVYKVLKSLCEEWLTKMASHTYENVKLDQVSAVNGDSLDFTRKLASGENIYEQGLTSNDPLPGRAAQSPVTEMGLVDGLKGHTLEASQASKGNPFSACGNVLQDGGIHQGDSVTQKPLTVNVASSEWPVHKTTVQAELGSPNKQKQTSDLGGPRVSPYESPYATILDLTPASPDSAKPSAPAFNGAKVPPPQSPRPQLPDMFIYSTVNKKGALPPPPNENVYSVVQKKTAKAPSPPVPSPKEVVYSTVNKPPAFALPRVSPLPPPKSANPSSHGDRSIYSLASDSGSESVFTNSDAVNTPYEIINYPGGSGGRTVSSGSRDRKFSNSSSILSIGQISSENIPGFNKRLPRVRGPVPVPQAWNKI